MVNATQAASIVAIAFVVMFILGRFIPELEFFTPGVGSLLLGVLLAVFVGFRIIQKDFVITKQRDLVGLLVVSGIVVLLFLLGLGVIGGEFFQASTLELKSALPAGIQAVLP